MKLTPSDLSFVAKRSRLAAYWPWVGSLMLVLLVGMAVWLWARVPLLVNPWVVFAQIEAGTMPDATKTMLAAMLPVVTLACLVFVAVAILLSLAAASNERRLLRILRRCRQTHDIE